MKKIVLFIALCAVLHAPFSALHAQIDVSDNETRQYVSWGVLAGTNISSFIMKMDPLMRDTLVADSVLTSLPSTGFSLNFFFDYHITQQWLLQAGMQFSLEQSLLRNSGQHSHLFSLGSDVTVAALFRFPMRGGTGFVSLGPYCHFVLYSDATENHNFYQRQIDVDPITGKVRYVVNNIHAGMCVAIGYEFNSRWMAQVEGRFGVKDMLNLKTHGTYVYPYRITFGVGCHF